MHHIGLPRSPFQQRPHSLISPSSTFAFSSPAFTHAFSPPLLATPTPQAVDGRAPSPFSSSSGLDTLESLQDGTGLQRSENGKEALLERLRGLMEKLEDEDNVLEGEAVGQIFGGMDSLEGLVGDGLKQRGVKESESEGFRERERMTLGEIRKSEEDSYLEVVSPSTLRQVREKVERQRRDKLRRIEHDGIEWDSRSGSRSSRWGQGSHSTTGSFDGKKDNEKNPPIEEPEMTVKQVTALAHAAEALSARLLTALTELQARKTESDEIHDLLVRRCEASTQRILLLEYRIAEMEDDFSANASELTFLRLQLQAIETQCAPYIARERQEDVELSDSIAKWKIDWEEVNRRTRERRGRKDVGLPPRVVRGASAEVPLRRSYSHHSERSGSENG